MGPSSSARMLTFADTQRTQGLGMKKCDEKAGNSRSSAGREVAAGPSPEELPAPRNMENSLERFISH